ncbi:predicted protein [Sclerotinia sclerotiorum 1980 UF-70]|uniref:Uncharacterized protein n=1 Tax=Sclerotinia sclerotiorum (strain ATCC 18683 / 1980 / Ss-1) TaxID=665079 RepID=A7F0P0_SCLS1|nr:predicted protein [Sclerotinia sclerotiorum 1980 UF-70]EDN95282.1 predicted protein [Sclerotinia sclerotiorum 1980 UF-70]
MAGRFRYLSSKLSFGTNSSPPCTHVALNITRSSSLPTPMELANSSAQSDGPSLSPI